jgi:pimeloyl-ACP methyl ester carboxylesterase
MQRVKLDDVEIAVQIVGDGEPVVFIHGALIADAFKPMLKQSSLVDHYRPAHYHRRGYGESDPATRPMSVAAQAADCRALIERLNIQTAHIVGQSYGGSIALQLALDAPSLVHSLALLEPAMMIGESGAGYRQSLVEGVSRYRAEGVDSLVSEFLEARTPGYRTMLDTALPGAHEQSLIDARTAFEMEIDGLLDWEFGEAEARRIKVPTLSVLGGESIRLSPRFEEVHLALQQWMPQAEGAILPNTTHFPQIEDPGALAEMLTDFWSRHPIDGSAQRM